MEGSLVVTASLDGDIRVWDPNPMRRRCLLVITRRCAAASMDICYRYDVMGGKVSTKWRTYMAIGGESRH